MSKNGKNLKEFQQMKKMLLKAFLFLTGGKYKIDEEYFVDLDPDNYQTGISLVSLVQLY